MGNIRSAPHPPPQITPGTENQMDMYNATIELHLAAASAAGKKGDQLLTRFADYHPVLTTSDLNRLELIISLPAESLWQAATTVRTLTDRLAVARVSLETSADFDARSDAIADPDLLSVTETAQMLGITRGGVQRRIETGALRAFRVGSTWAIPAGAARTNAASSTALP